MNFDFFFVINSIIIFCIFKPSVVVIICFNGYSLRQMIIHSVSSGLNCGSNCGRGKHPKNWYVDRVVEDGIYHVCTG